MLLILSSQLAQALPREGAFDAVLELQGQLFRQHRHRRTIRCELGGEAYFLKIHGHTGWREILKNVLRGRVPTLTALPEWRALQRLRDLGVPTIAAAGVGRRGWNPARLESFLFTRELSGMMHLDDAARAWLALPPKSRFHLKRQMILEVASLAAALHRNGMNHRDCYLCHFMLPAQDFNACVRGTPLGLHIIDLHRAQIRRHTPARWIAKDLSGLLFSSLDAGVTSIDVARFLRAYAGEQWRDMVRRRRWFLRHIIRRAARLYRSEHGRPAPVPASLASF